MRIQTDSLSPHTSSSLQYKIIPAVESQAHFARYCGAAGINTIILRHCNIFEFSGLLERASKSRLAVYVNIDQIAGLHPDAAGLAYLHQHHVNGIISNHPRILALGKACGLSTIQRVFAVDSTGLELSLDSIDTRHVDQLDISPALVIPYLTIAYPLPFIASGLIFTYQQVQEVLDAGARGVVVGVSEL